MDSKYSVNSVESFEFVESFKRLKNLDTGKLLSLKEVIGRDIFNYNIHRK